MKFHKSTLIFAIMLAGLTALSAWSISDTYFGNRIAGLDARGYALGGSGTMDDMRSFGIALNPANLTQMLSPFGAQGSLLLDRNEDNRHLPLYNSFDSYTDDAVYASNINFFYDYAGAGHAFYPFGKFKVGLGAYYKPLLSFDGIYYEEIRNNRNTDNDGYPEKLAMNEIDNEGSLNQAAGVFSLGYQFADNYNLNLGLDYSALTGSATNRKSITWSQWAIDQMGNNNLPDSLYMEDVELDGGRLKAGLTAKLGAQYGLGLTYSAKASLDRTGSVLAQKEAYYQHAADSTLTAFSGDYILPAEIRFGLNYQPRNIMRTWFQLDVEYVKWTDVADNYDDVFNLYAGVEHYVINRLPLRLGFQAVTSYFRNLETVTGDLDEDPSTPDESTTVDTPVKFMTPMITGGTSVKVTDNIAVDLGFGYSWREFEALDMFRDAYYREDNYASSNNDLLWPNYHIDLQDRGWENPDKVRENNISFNASLSIQW